MAGTIRSNDQITPGSCAISDDDVWKALETADIRDTVAAIPEGLDAPYNDSLFSHGQKQLLMIARAIVSDPRILLLDEITAGVDSATEEVVTDALMKASEGRTVLSISHRLPGKLRGRTVRLGC